MTPTQLLLDSETSTPPSPLTEDALTSRVRITGWSLLTIAGVIEAAFSRHSMQDDGVSYLDMGDALVRGDWKMGLNAIWSPLYPLLQGLALRIVKPSTYSQFTVVHLVNFLIYLFALGCFEFLLRVVVAHRGLISGLVNDRAPLPKWAVFAIGYSVFFWSSISLISIRKVVPDMLMAGFLYLALALLVQISQRPRSWSRFVPLGVALGFGYLAKAPMFPLALVCFAMAWFLAGAWPYATPRVLAAIVVFLAISAPWFIALSHAKGRFMFGDSARFNYVTHVNGAGPDWYFQDLGTATGRFVHPMRKIFDSPPIYEFAMPLKATTPVGYDPAYWSEGAVPRVSLKRQLSVIRGWLRFYLELVWSSQSGLLVGFVVLCFMGGRAQSLQQITSRWPLLLTAFFGLGMYALVHTEDRYVAVLFCLLWMGLFSGLQMPPGFEGRRLVVVVTLAVVIVTAGPAAFSVAGHLRGAVRGEAHIQWQVAEDLKKLGVKSGDRVARFPAHFGLAWARLLQVTTVAELPQEHAADFWCAKPETQAQAIDSLRRVGVSVIVAEQIPPIKPCAPSPAWLKVGDGTYYALKLEPSGIR